MSFWQSIKRGFGYGLGGRIGWELGGFIWRWVSRAVLALVLGITAQCAAFSMAHKQPQQPAAQVVEKRQHRQVKKPAPRPEQQVEVVQNPIQQGSE